MYAQLSKNQFCHVPINKLIPYTQALDWWWSTTPVTGKSTTVNNNRYVGTQIVWI